MDFTNWKFRASQMGDLMAGNKPNLTEKQESTLIGLLDKRDNGKITDKQTSTLGDLIAKRDAKPKLLKTATNKCDEIFQEVVFGRSKELTNRYLEKGISQEEVSLSLYQDVVGDLVLKNEENYQNDYFTGTPDCCHEKVIDIKSSWSYSSFPMNDMEIKNKAYYYQLQVYMNLTGLETAELAYCLVDTPSNLIDDELRKLSWNSGAISLDSIPTKIKVETVQNLIYTVEGLEKFCLQSTDFKLEWFDNFKPIRPENRLKIFAIDYDVSTVRRMREYVELGRDYLAKSAAEVARNIRA